MRNGLWIALVFLFSVFIGSAQVSVNGVPGQTIVGSGVPISVVVTNPVGGSTIPATVISATGVVTLGCYTVTQTVAGLDPTTMVASYSPIPLSNPTQSDLLVPPSAIISAVNTLQIQRCNTQLVSLSGTSAISYLVPIYLRM